MTAIPSSAACLRQFKCINPNGSANAFYDPLYGLSASYVLDILYPVSDDGFRSETQAVRSVLSDYLEILRFQFSKHPTPFGASPYNLDLLLELTRMPYADLERNVLAFLPQPLSGQLMGFASPERQPAEGLPRRPRLCPGHEQMPMDAPRLCRTHQAEPDPGGG